jgi:LysM repeat protein
MSTKLTWRVLMETRMEQRRKLQTPTLIAVVVSLHVVAVGSIVMMQGCGSPRRPVQVEPAPTPIMPSQPMDANEPETVRSIPPTPVFQPPVAVERAPAQMPPADPQVHEVRRGDNLSTIAQRYGVTKEALVDLNQLANPDVIVVGQKLLIPGHADMSAAPQSAAPAPASRRPVTAEGASYVVQANDNLSAIAQRYGVSVKAIVEANGLTDPNRIQVGQSLVIPGAAAPRTPESVPAPEPAPVPTPAPVDPSPTAPMAPDVVEPISSVPSMQPAPATPLRVAFDHEVREGDTLSSIASDYTVLEEELIALNNLSADAQLQPGQVVRIPEINEGR